MQLTRNFSRKELQCKGCSNSYCPSKQDPICNIDPGSLDKLQKLRDLIGLPLTIHSACRCRPHNAAIGGADNSYHIADSRIASRAFDVGLPRLKGKQPYADRTMKPEELLVWGRKAGFTSFGLYNTFVHMDDREFPAVWDYRK